MEWISVKDRLPDYEIRVLLCDCHDWIFTGIRGLNGYECSMGEEPGCEITYWMPLPNPPKPFRSVMRNNSDHLNGPGKKVKPHQLNAPDTGVLEENNER